ncbi:MAG: choice-of-anchor P family protein [Nocardioides sp.]
MTPPTKHTMKHHTILIAGVVALCTGLVLATGPGFARQSGTRTTTYAFKSTGYGTRVLGGQVPAGSQTSGFQVIGCTNRAGVSRENNVGQADVPGLGTASDIKTRVWTTDRKGVVASHSRHTIGHLDLASTGVGSLSLDSIRSTTRAYHDSSGFHATASTSLGGITLTPPTGPAQSFPAPAPGQPVDIPGLATIYAGRTHVRHDDSGALAEAVALRIDVIPTDTSVKVGHSRSELDSGLTYGVFGGHSDGTSVPTAAGGIAKSGRNPLSVMPCQGTQGTVHRKAIDHSDLGGQAVARGLATKEWAKQGASSAHGYERGSVAKFSLGGGQLVIRGIVGKAAVSRDAHGIVRSARGTSVGTVKVNGQAQSFPPTGVLEIPGVAKLERHVVTRTKTGLQVIGLRVTLLDGTGAVFDLGEATMRVRSLPH